VTIESSNIMTADERNALERFPVIAEEFCHLIDNRDKRNRKQLVHELAVHLARLCEVAVRLPLVQPSTVDIDNTPEDLAVHTEEWAKLSGKLRQIFGPLDVYWEVFDPTQREDPVSCSLAIDIAEIYLDLKDALRFQKSGAALNDLYWQWRFDSHSHWSKHATGALRTLFHILDLS
jgi:Domain of unknown function (DUF5063)